MKKILLIIAVIFSATTLKSQIKYSDQQLVAENDLIKQTISFKGNRVKITSFYSKILKNDLLYSNNASPWFEFVINNQLITSDLPIWKYRSHSVREMANGGEEIKIVIDAISQVKGLQLHVYRQIFPHSTLVREKLVLLNTDKTPLALNKLNNKLHFVFPQYEITTLAKADTIKEIRLATFGKEILDEYNPSLTYDDRTFDGGRDLNLAHAHMFHPEIKEFATSENKIETKGPITIYKAENFNWLMAYEHASQDENYGREHENAQKDKSSSDLQNDQLQGVSGNMGLKETPDDFWFLSLTSQKKNLSAVLSVEILRGGYLDGEQITVSQPYESVWTASALYLSNDEEKPIIHEYLWNQITEHLPSRKSHFYYNTWGMQRDNRNTVGLRDIFTEERIIKEIRNAAELKVDLFVLDDGWEEAIGVWTPHKTRLPKGLAPLVAEMKAHNIIPGIWLSPMGIDSLSERFKNHQEWVLCDEKGKPISAQWGQPAFDFVSDFYDLFVQDCKVLVDQGIRFFKWDAINTFNSTIPNMRHGSDQYSKEEIRDRYGYLLPIYVTKAMKELREYNPEVVVEIDLTEKERCVIGLMPLQEGKLFWMNNGASGYNDYSTYRTKSMRTVINQYAGIVPIELFTQAVYPHNTYPYFAQRYNINTSLVGGRGFWGNLDLMNSLQRVRVGDLVEKSKVVLPYISHLPIKVDGKVGASPEIYVHVNEKEAAGQIIGFSGEATVANVSSKINGQNLLGILNHAYQVKNDSVLLPFQFTMPDDTREAFLIPNEGTGITIISSTGWLDKLKYDIHARTIAIVPGNDGEIELEIGNKHSIKSINPIDASQSVASEKTSIGYKIKLKAGKGIILNF